jgi:hypothetical protein
LCSHWWSFSILDGDKTSEELTNRTKDTSEEIAETPSSSETISS